MSTESRISKSFLKHYYIVKNTGTPLNSFSLFLSQVREAIKPVCIRDTNFDTTAVSEVRRYCLSF